MLNDKRVCQLMLPCFIIEYLANDRDHRASIAVMNYVDKNLKLLLKDKPESFDKLQKRLRENAFKVHEMSADKQGMVKGKKMVLVAHFLTQLIFDEKNGKLTETYLQIAKITERLIRFNTKFFENNVAEEDASKLIPSAEKQAKKVFETIYKEL